MNKVIILVVLAFSSMVNAQRKPKIKGNKTVIEVRKELPQFSAIQLSDDLDIELQKATAEGVHITADDNLIDVLKFKVKDGTLHISSFYKITAKKKLEIKINYVELTDITLEDGKLTMNDVVSSEALTVKTLGASRIVLNGSADLMRIHMSGMSSGDFNLAGDSLNINLKERVDMRVYAVVDTAIINIEKSATAKLEGTTNAMLVNLLGNAKLKAEKFEAQMINASLEDTTNAQLNPIDRLELSAKGASKTQVYGAGKIVLHNFLDSAQLRKEK